MTTQDRPVTPDERPALEEAYRRLAADHWPAFELALQHPLFLRILRLGVAHPPPPTVQRGFPQPPPYPEHRYTRRAWDRDSSQETKTPLDNKRRASGEKDDD